MTRYRTNVDTIDSLDFAARDHSYKDLPTVSPCRVPTASQVATCPPCHWIVTYRDRDTVETCRKCGTERTRPRFDAGMVGKPDEVIRSLIKVTHKELAAMRNGKKYVPQARPQNLSRATYTPEQVKVIRSSNLSSTDLVALFGGSRSTINDCRGRRTYVQIP